MPFRTACPNCRSSYLLDERQDGQTVRCKYCSAPFTARSPNNPAPIVQPIPLCAEEPNNKRVQASPPPVAPRKGKTPVPPARLPRRQLEIDPEPERTPPPMRLNLGFLGGLGALLVLGGALLWMFAAASVTNHEMGPPTVANLDLPPVQEEAPVARVQPKESAPVASARDVPSALALLRSTGPADRKAGLTWLQSAPVDQLRRDEVATLLNDILGDAGLRDQALPVVARWGTGANAGKLASLLDEPMSGHWKRVVEILAKMEDDRAQEAAARQLLTQGRAAEAAVALREAPPRAAEKHVARHMHHPEPGVREEVGRLLRHYRTPDTLKVEQTIDDLESKDARTRLLACDWLRRQKPVADLQEKAARALEGRLEDRVEVGILAIAALEGWATKESVKPVCGAMAHAAYQRSALAILARLKDEASIGTLVEYMRSHHAKTVAALLASFGAKAEKPTWQQLGNADWGVRVLACAVLGEVGGPESLEKVSQLAAKDKIRAVRLAAAEAIKKIKARQK